MKISIRGKQLIGKGTSALSLRDSEIYVHNVQDIHHTQSTNTPTTMAQHYSVAQLDSSLPQTCLEAQPVSEEMLTATVSGRLTFVPVHDQEGMAPWRQERGLQ